MDARTPDASGSPLTPFTDVPPSAPPDPDGWDAWLTERVRTYRTLNPEDREQVQRGVRDLSSRNVPPTFLLSSARALARELAAQAEETDQPADAERQKFIEANALPPDERISARRQPRSEAKARERDAYLAGVRRLVREARSAHQPHERKRLRRELMGVDQKRLRRILGVEGVELSEQIRELLLRSSDLR